MLQHAGIALQLQRFFNGVNLTAFVARLLHHAKDPVVSLDMIVGTLAMVPLSKDNHLVKLVFADLLERFGQKRIGLVQRIIDQARAARARTWLGHAFGKEAVKRLVAWPKELACGCHLKQERQVCHVLLTEVVLFADNEILMLPDEAGLRLLAHATAVLAVLLGLLGRRTGG